MCESVAFGNAMSLPSRPRATLPNLSALGAGGVEQVLQNLLTDILSLLPLGDGNSICSWVKIVKDTVRTSRTSHVFNEAVKALGNDIEAQAVLVLDSVGIFVPRDEEKKPVVPWGYKTFLDCAVDVCTTLSNLTFRDPKIKEEFYKLSKPFNMQASNEGREPFKNPQQLKLAMRESARWTDSVTRMSHCLWVHASYGPICAWNVEQVTSLTNLFCLDPASLSEDRRGLADDLYDFNQPLDRWNVCNVTSMKYAFCKAASFNQPLNAWNVSNVTDMYGMFLQAKSFNQPLDKWKVSKVTIMNKMFAYAKAFDQNLKNWEVQNVTSMNHMFWFASNFNGDISKWNVGRVKFMNYMFSDATKFNGDISKWDVGEVNYMNGMFRRASSFNKPLERWNVTNVIEMLSMFQEASAFDQPLNKWNVEKVMTMEYMFYRATSYSQNFSGWNLQYLSRYSQFGVGSNILEDNLQKFERAAESQQVVK